MLVVWFGLHRGSVKAFRNATKLKQERNYMKKEKNDKKPTINTVSFVYSGTDQQFNQFLKAVIHDYVSDDKTAPDQPTDHSEQSLIA